MMKCLSSLLFALLLAACSAGGIQVPDLAALFEPPPPDTRALSGPIRTVTRPAAALPREMEVTSLVDGTRKTFMTQPYGNGVRVRESNGCVWTRADDWFSPSDSWANCGLSSNWHTAQARVRELNSLYPLKVGSVGRYERSAVSHTGRSYTRETRCEVTDAVEVVRRGRATTPVFVVECDDTSRRRTTWYAPGEGPIAYREVHRRNGVEEAWVRTN
jgi:hypothetical protein